jgi:ABC-2 type transport system permease protein
MSGHVTTALSMGLREFRRTPVLLALLAVLPAYFVGVFVVLVPDETVQMLLDGTAASVPMSAFAAAFMTPLTVAVLSGIVGLFLVQTSREADDRLRLAGYSTPALILSRVGILGVGSAVVTAVSILVALRAFSPEHLGVFVAATLLVGLSYGFIGVIVGLAVDRLGGVYVMLFAPMVDVLMFQNPLATEMPAWTKLLPSHYATNVLFDAAFSTGVETGEFVSAAAYAVALLTAGMVVFHRATTVR